MQKRIAQTMTIYDIDRLLRYLQSAKYADDATHFYFAKGQDDTIAIITGSQNECRADRLQHTS